MQVSSEIQSIYLRIKEFAFHTLVIVEQQKINCKINSHLKVSTNKPKLH